MHLRTSTLASIATAGISAFVVIIVLLHALESEFNPSSRMVSEYALGDYGLLLNAAAMLLAFGSAFLAVGLRQVLRTDSRTPTLLLAVWFIGAVIAGLFNTDPKGAPGMTTGGAIHAVAVAVAVLALIYSAFLFVRCFQRDTNWGTLVVPTRWWALAMLVTTVATVPAAESEVGGIVQRIWIIVLIGWLARVAIHLRTTSIRPTSGVRAMAEGPIR